MSWITWRWFRACVLSAVLLLSACSGTTFVYNRLDFLLPWYVEDYANLNGEQESYLDELLVPFLVWHRNRELPQYLDVIERVEDSLNHPLEPSLVAVIFVDFEAAWLRLQDEALDWLLALGARLSDQQIADFTQELWELQGEYEEEYLERTDEEFYEESYDNMVDNAQDYLGRLSAEQRELLRESSRRLLRSDNVWLQERADWLTQLGVLLERKTNWQQQVTKAVAARNDNISPEYRRIFEHNLDVSKVFIAQLLNMRTESQDRFLRSKLSELREDLLTLIAQGKDAALVQ